MGPTFETHISPVKLLSVTGATESWTFPKNSDSALDAFERKYKQSEEPSISDIIKLKVYLRWADRSQHIREKRF
jgi:hypothetical protein